LIVERFYLIVIISCDV